MIGSENTRWKAAHAVSHVICITLRPVFCTALETATQYCDTCCLDHSSGSETVRTPPSVFVLSRIRTSDTAGCRHYSGHWCTLCCVDVIYWTTSATDARELTIGQVEIPAMIKANTSLFLSSIGCEADRLQKHLAAVAKAVLTRHRPNSFGRVSLL